MTDVKCQTAVGHLHNDFEDPEDNYEAHYKPIRVLFTVSDMYVFT